MKTIVDVADDDKDLDAQWIAYKLAHDMVINRLADVLHRAGWLGSRTA